MNEHGPIIRKTTHQKLAGIFAKHGLDTKFAVVKVSDRPDLSDFQCNGALALAKPLRGTRVRLPL